MNLLSRLSPTGESAVLLALVLAQATLVLALALLLAKAAGKHNPAARHAVLLGGLVLLFAGPVLVAVCRGADVALFRVAVPSEVAAVPTAPEAEPAAVPLDLATFTVPDPPARPASPIPAAPTQDRPRRNRRPLSRQTPSSRPNRRESTSRESWPAARSWRGWRARPFCWGAWAGASAPSRPCVVG